MAKFTKGTFEYHIVDGFDKVFDEKGNKFGSVRKVIWGEDDGSPGKLEIRRWIATTDGERASSGYVFNNQDKGPTELVHILLECGYGDTSKVINIVSKREDFFETIKSYLGDTFTEEQAEFFINQLDDTSIDSATEFYDPRDEFNYDEEEVPFEEDDDLTDDEIVKL